MRLLPRTSRQAGSRARRNKLCLACAGKTGVTAAAELIGVPSLGASIGTGRVGDALSALLVGYFTQDGRVTLSVTFLDVDNLGIATGLIGPVTSADCRFLTGLLNRSATGFAPTGTRSINVLLTHTRLQGSANDGQADNLSLVPTQSAITGAVREPAAWGMMLGGFGLIGIVARRHRRIAVVA